MLTRIFENWTIIRAIKLGFGAYALFEGIANGDWMIGSLATYLMITSLFNLGCAAGSCTLPSHRQDFQTKNNGNSN